MTTQKITIHRALAELKIIDDRIKRQLNEFRPVGIRQKDRPVNDYYDLADFENDASKTFQSVNDLITRKNNLKNAIVKANAETKVQIGDKKMTIADAINFKTLIEYKKALANRLEQVLHSSKAELEKMNARIDENVQKLLEAALGKDQGKWDKTSVAAIQEPYEEKNKFELVDPLNAEKTVSELRKDIEDFESEVDATLSEINAITFIEIEQ